MSGIIQVEARSTVNSFIQGCHTLKKCWHDQGHEELPGAVLAAVETVDNTVGQQATQSNNHEGT